MLINITVTGKDAKALSYILRKNPENILSADFSGGKVVVFFPEYSENKATASLLTLIDTVGMVRSEWQRVSSSYVDYRPYAASSLSSVAMKEVYSSAFSGKTDLPEIAEVIQRELPIEVELSSVYIRGGIKNVIDFFEPLGYKVDYKELPFESTWLKNEISTSYNVVLSGNQTIPNLLKHLYVLLPVMDNKKHYFVEQGEIEKLLRHGEGWLEKHPAKERIVSRYLLRFRNLVEEALEQLIDDQPDDNQDEGTEESEKEEPIRLQEERLQSTIAILKTLNPPPLRVGDLGCGSGALIKLLVPERSFEEIIGMDVSSRALLIGEKKLRLAKRQDWQKPKVSLLHGSLVYMDSRLKELDTILLLEVIEHLEPAKISILEHNIFEYISPRYIIVSTPNFEYNQLFPNFQTGKYRHTDHRFEWTRAEFKQWAEKLGEKYSYTLDYYNIGTPDEKLGPPTQMVVFRKKDN